MIFPKMQQPPAQPSQQQQQIEPVVQLTPVVIPSYSAWFSISTINDIEKTQLPEFFNSKNKSKSPQIYMQYRNFMVNTYRLNPHEYLTVTACRRNLCGDVCAIIRVHQVLEQWGLINYQVDVESKPSLVGPAFTGHFRVSVDTPKGLQPLLPSVDLNQTTVGTNLKVEVKSDVKLESLPSTFTMTESSTNKRKLEDDAESTKKIKIICASCNTALNNEYYHCQKPTIDICSNCYTEARFPQNAVSKDFVLFKNEISNGWTQQETLLLLEAIEMFDDDWTKIQAHVKTRSREECVLYFLKVRFANFSYLSRIHLQVRLLLETKVCEVQPVWVLDANVADNPMLTLASYLCSSVPPKVAQAAAQAAINKLNSTEPPSKNETDKANEKAGAAALASAAVKSQLLSKKVESEMQQKTIALVQLQLRKMELKLQRFQELEMVLDNERREIEREREQLYVERLRLKNGNFEKENSVQSVDVGDDSVMDVDNAAVLAL